MKTKNPVINWVLLLSKLFDISSVYYYEYDILNLFGGKYGRK